MITKERVKRGVGFVKGNIPEKFKISQFRDGRCFTMMIKKPSNPGPAPPLRSETEGTQTEEAQRGVVREAEKPG